jgi:Ser/Thr protein kinase RdoA (MazF antagonist)
MPTTDALLRAASSIAPAFGIHPEAIEVLSHSENVVCDLTLPGGRHVVMRLHRPGYNTLDELRSEVLWVASLGAAGIPVPRPLPTIDNEYYTSVDIGGEAHHVGLVEWVNGQPLGSVIPSHGGANDPDVDDRGADDRGEHGIGDPWRVREFIDHFRSIGEIAAQIRVHNDDWSQPADFQRRRWDADGLVGDTPLWGRFWEVAGLTDRQRAVFSQARSVLRERLSTLSTGADRFGLIHADLHLGNLMADGDRLTVIDFDDAGFGWFPHELAVALHPVMHELWYHDARASLLAGYRKFHPLADDEEQLIDTFLAVRCLTLVGWLDARPEVPEHELLPGVVAQATSVAENYLAANDC